MRSRPLPPRTLSIYHFKSAFLSVETYLAGWQAYEHRRSRHYKFELTTAFQKALDDTQREIYN